MRALFALFVTISLCLPASSYAAQKKARGGKQVSLQKNTVVSSPPAPRDKALEPCRPITTSEKDRITADTPGYKQVTVRMVVDVPEEKDPREELKNMYLSFALYTSPQGVRQDRDGAIMDIGFCSADHVSQQGRYFPGGTLWLRVMMAEWEVGWINYTLQARIPLPAVVVRQKPRAFTVLRSEIEYRGEWDGDILYLKRKK